MIMLRFLKDLNLDDDLGRVLMAQLRNLWTHDSTALEGKTCFHLSRQTWSNPAALKWRYSSIAAACPVLACAARGCCGFSTLEGSPQKTDFKVR